jgi:putative membrane protein
MVALASLIVLLVAQTSAADGRPEAGPSTLPDRRFVQEAAASGRAAVELCALGAKRAQDPAVRELARHVADDHEATNKEMMQLAKRLEIPLATRTDPGQKALLGRLSRLAGAEFDRQYIAALVDGHREVVETFEYEAEAGRDPDVKSFAERTLPTLRHHLDLARATADAAGATAGSK